MSEYFIQKLFIKDVRGIRDFEIPLSETERKHLIITGKNGSGKTSVLLEINATCSSFFFGGSIIARARKETSADGNGIKLFFMRYLEALEQIESGRFILAFFPAKRKSEPEVPQTPTKDFLKVKYETTDSILSKQFIQYMLNLKTNQAFAQIKNDMKTVRKIGDWFDNLEAKLKELFGESELKLVFYY